VSDFLPPDGISLQAAGEALGQRLGLARGGVLEADSTFYDTFDGLLHAEDLVLVGEAGRLSLMQPGAGVERAGIAMDAPTRPLLALELDPGPLRDALLPIVEVRALLPIAHLRSRVRAFDVLDDQRKTVVRIRLQEPALISSDGRLTPLGPRLTLGLVRGYDNALAQVQDTLVRELGFKVADCRLVEEAVAAAGGVPGGHSSKIDLPLSESERADAATAAVLRALLEVMQLNIEGMIADTDSEFLHDFRVAVRRSRAVQRELKRVFAPAPLARFREQFRWLQAITGEARDLDVYVLEFDQYRAMLPESMRAELGPLLGVLSRRRRSAHRTMVRALRSERAARLYADWSDFLEGLEAAPVQDRPDATRPIGPLAGERISKVYRRMLKQGGAIDHSSPPERYHELRKQGKELRYLLELFGVPLYPAEVVKPMVKLLKSLQDVLGRHQDREVQVATLRSLGEAVSALPAGPGALMAMGVLIERLGEDERAARAEFAQSFAAFSSESQRRLVKDTFT
jgi:CHAD domain-containing protein